MVRQFRDTSSIHSIISCRENGSKCKYKDNSRMKKHLTEAIQRVNTWDPLHKTDGNDHHGGIFNFDFSPDGSLLVAACEHKSFLVFDPYNADLLTAKTDAHTDCVNCVRFLDNRTFATCSDDTTVCLWDSRYLKRKMCTLKRGHSNWVKNIEYAREHGVLLTSGFDGSIYKWEINRYTRDDEVECERVYHTAGLMRTRLSPDCSKLLLASSDGYLVVVHNLNLDTLSADLKEFKPTYLPMLQARGQLSRFKHLFTRWRNRVEIVNDFPSGDDAHIVASLEAHPQGWCMASRNTVQDESSEWTCIHDIHTHTDLKEDELFKDVTSSLPQSSTDDSPQSSSTGSEEPASTQLLASDGPLFSSIHLGNYRQVLGQSGQPGAAGTSDRPPSPTIFVQLRLSQRGSEAAPETDSNREGRNVTFDHSGQGLNSVPEEYEEGDEEEEEDFWEGEDSDREDNASSSGEEPPPPPPAAAERLSSSRSETTSLADSVTFILRSGTAAAESAERVLLSLGQRHLQRQGLSRKFVSPTPRLSHYIQESNQGKGYIKEIAFSKDGRLLCSPFGFGIRLLAFDSMCSELCDCVPESPVELYEVTSVITHRSVVLTSKFSPTQSLLVTGCKEGKIDFHQPRF